MSVLLFLVGFLEKWMKSCKPRQIVGVLHRGVGIPSSSVGPRQGVACPHRDVVEREDWLALGTSHRCGEGLCRNVAVLAAV